MPAGRPPKYKSVDDMSAKIDEYFAECDDKQEPYTITGLAYYLGFTSRMALINYEGKAEFVDTIKKAKLKVELGYEKALHKGNATSGMIFALKNFGWSDKQEIAHSGNMTFNGISIEESKGDE